MFEIGCKLHFIIRCLACPFSNSYKPLEEWYTFSLRLAVTSANISCIELCLVSTYIIRKKSKDIIKLVVMHEFLSEAKEQPGNTTDCDSHPVTYV